MYIRLIGSGERGILEPFYDGGEAYREYHKYETIKNVIIGKTNIKSPKRREYIGFSFYFNKYYFMFYIF